MRWSITRRAAAVFGLLLAWSVCLNGTLAAPSRDTGTYTNPLAIQTSLVGTGVGESCADPTVISGQPTGDDGWYLFCTKDPLNDQDRDADGTLRFHNITIQRSVDLVNWTYVGDAFDAVPTWGEPAAGVWAPDVVWSNGLYYLYYALTDTTDAVSGEPGCGFDPAIGVATSTSLAGPWQDSGRPVVEPRRAAPGCSFFATIDPDVLATPDGQRFIYYGSYAGGIEARSLSADGFSTDPASATPITVADRYEGAEVVLRNGFYYLFASAANCCNGPLTGYGVFVGRSASPTGPFVDQQGASLLAAQVGGTPVISMNGNRWVGPGHNTVFQDRAGQWWTIYHAIDMTDPYFADPNPNRVNKRPALLDPLDWANDWPMLRGGAGPSDGPQAAPAAQPGQASSYEPMVTQPTTPSQQRIELSDEFRGALGPQWSWVREPDASSYGVTNGTLRFDTQPGDLYADSNSASVLSEPTPNGNYMVEARLKLNVPSEGSGFDYVQAGLVIYGSDDAFIKLTNVAIGATRQTEFAKEVPAGEPGQPRYGNAVGGPPGEWTWLRIVKQQQSGQEWYTAYTSTNGSDWVRGSTWTHTLGRNARIGLVTMGRAGFAATFDYVRVYRLDR